MSCPFAHSVMCCCVLLRKVWNRSNFWANNSQHFFSSMIAEAQQCWIPVHGSSNIAHYTWSPWRLQGLMGCILPTMHCRSQHCRELSHHFAHHCQPGRNNSEHCWQHCWPNFARSFNCKIYWTYRKGLIWDHKTIKITLRENLYVECLDC